MLFIGVLANIKIHRMYIKLISLIILMFLFSKCNYNKECKNKIEYSYYSPSNVRTKTVKDYKNRIIFFEQYQFDCKKCSFKVYYSSDESPDSLDGKVWMHVIWNDTAEYFEMVNKYRFNGKPWVTLRRKQPISVEF